MSSAATQVQLAEQARALSLKEGFIVLFLMVSPFYMFAVVGGRDWPAVWVLLALAVAAVAESVFNGGDVWIDRSFTWLWLFVAVYIVATLIVLFQYDATTLLGRTPVDRSITVTLRVVLVAVAFTLFVHVMAGLPLQSLRRLFIAEMSVGLVIASFGVLQYITYMVFGSASFIELEPTSETYRLYSSFIGHGAERTYRAASVFNEPSVFGFFLAPLLIKAIVARMRNVSIGPRWFHTLVLVMLILAVLVNISMTSTMAVGVMLGILVIGLVRRQGRLIPVLLGLAGLLLLIAVTPVGSLIFTRVVRVFDLNDLSTLDRLFRAQSGVNVFLANPWFGVGPGGFAYHHPRFGQIFFGGMASPLNTWLWFLTDVGLFGCIPFVMFITHIIRRGRNAVRHEPLVGVYLWSLGTYAVLLSTIDSWFLEIIWFQLAMIVALSNVAGRKATGLPG